MTNKTKVAVIGFGWWGKTIVRTLLESAGVQVLMVVEPDAAVRKLAEAIVKAQNEEIAFMRKWLESKKK